MQMDHLETQPWDGVAASPPSKHLEVIDLDTPKKDRVKQEPLDSDAVVSSTAPLMEPGLLPVAEQDPYAGAEEPEPSELPESTIPTPMEPEPSQHAESPIPKPFEPEPSQQAESPIPKPVEAEPSQQAESPIPKPFEPEPSQQAASAHGVSNALSSPDPTPKPKPSAALYANDLTPGKQVLCCKINKTIV